MKKYTVSATKPPGLNVTWDYASNYFPRSFHYQADAVKCRNTAKAKGSPDAKAVRLSDGKVLA